MGGNALDDHSESEELHALARPRRIIYGAGERRGMRRPTIMIVAPLLVSVLAGSCASSDDAAKPPIDAGQDTVVDIPDVVHDRVPYTPDTGAPVPRVAVQAQTISTRVDTASLLFAAGEMQISGEPFANGFAGRNLAFYDRNRLPTDQYVLNLGGPNESAVTDVFGFSTAVESYEYSKYHMNMLIEQTSAGVSLANGPVIATEQGQTSLDKLRARSAELMTAAGTDIGGYATLPAPTNNPLNYLGFSGLWPVLAPFASFDSALAPTLNVVKSCTFSGGYGGIGNGTSQSPQYECVYNTLHLPNRDTQVDKTITPSVLGFATWKEALWAIDFAGRIHDVNGNQLTSVNPADVPKVGTPKNVVKANDPGATFGTYIGSSPLEGMWGLFMLAMMDNESEWLTTSLLTSDGATLGGFSKRADAIAYDYTSPLRWFPASIKLVEDGSVVPYPAIGSLTISDASAHSSDLSALLLGHAMFFGMTDPRNAGIGQRVGLQATFDGDPFAADDGVADGEATAHDRALAVLRVAFVDLDRMFADPTLGVFIDTATVSNGNVMRGSVTSTTSIARSLIALRQTLLSLNGSITQYGAPDPDPAADLKGILNSSPIHPPGNGSPTMSARVRQVFLTNAAFVRDVLTKADGTVANSATVTNGVATPSNDPTLLESQAAAVRALVEAFLLSGDDSYRQRAQAVVKRLEAAFYSAPARMYRAQDGGKDEIHVNAERFAWLQSALRESYKVLHVPGDPALDRAVLSDRIGRMHKLFLNGWDDLNGDESVDTTTECLSGRLQMAEQALTGELGRDANNVPTADRDSDCVPELAHAKHASVLASDVFFHSP